MYLAQIPAMICACRPRMSRSAALTSACRPDIRSTHPRHGQLAADGRTQLDLAAALDQLAAVYWRAGFPARR